MLSATVPYTNVRTRTLFLNGKATTVISSPAAPPWVILAGPSATVSLPWMPTTMSLTVLSGSCFGPICTMYTWHLTVSSSLE